MINKARNSLSKTIFFTGFALIAFAANSVLCRLALGDKTIDAASFTVVRLLSGVIALLIILKLTSSKNRLPTKGNWPSALMLFLYAVTFSFAYISLDTGTGALILFGSVQITMILITLASGDRLHIAEWTGVLIAFTGFVYLVLPNVTKPSILGFLLMTIAGIAWGIYTLLGRGTRNPLADTTKNFVLTIPLAIVLAVFTIQYIHLSAEGVLLAILSGAVASGIGYTLWYIALGGLSATLAAVVQLLVPIIAALGGVIFVSETISLRMVLSAVMVLGGILIVVLGRYYFAQLKVLDKSIKDEV